MNEIEKSNNFKSLAFLRVSKPFLQKYGLDAAVIIAELVYWHSQMIRKISVKANDGYFFYEMFKIEKATGITPHRQRKAMDILCKAGILDVKDEKKGIPPKRFYKVNVRAYEDEVTQSYLSKVEEQIDNIVFEEKPTLEKPINKTINETEKYCLY